jgi:o-succinylbenzoate synthase
MRVARSRVLLTPGEGRGRPFVRLALEDEAGRVGIGEASPLAGFSADDAASCAAALLGIEARLGPLDEDVERALAPVLPVLGALPSARFALETALFDLAGQTVGLSVAELLAGKRAHAEVAVNGLLDASAEDLVPAALDLVARGRTALKIKLRGRDNGGFTRELRALEGLRRALPPPFELRLDPNAAWTLEEARHRLEALAPLAIRFVEQPVAQEALEHLGPTPVPWAADESLRIPGLADKLAGLPGCTAFVLKPAVLGGLLRALAMARIAADRGVDLVVTHLFDGPVGMAAACELSRALPRPPLASGLDAHPVLATYPPLAIPQATRAGRVQAPARPGLGFTEEERSRWMA